MTGKPADVINGIQFVQNDLIPSGKLLLMDGNMKGGQPKAALAA